MTVRNWRRERRRRAEAEPGRKLSREEIEEWAKQHGLEVAMSSDEKPSSEASDKPPERGSTD